MVRFDVSGEKCLAMDSLVQCCNKTGSAEGNYHASVAGLQQGNSTLVNSTLKLSDEEPDRKGTVVELIRQYIGLKRHPEVLKKKFILQYWGGLQQYGVKLGVQGVIMNMAQFLQCLQILVCGRHSELKINLEHRTAWYGKNTIY
jgi:hypothetical protein